MIKKRKIVITRFFKQFKWYLNTTQKARKLYKHIFMKFHQFFKPKQTFKTTGINPYYVNTYKIRIDSENLEKYNWSEADTYGEVFIQRIRFKPGYQRIWRQARTAIKEALKLRYVYQYRLTRYLMRFSRKLNGYFVHFSEFSIERMVMYSKLLPDTLTLNLFLTHRLLYLNGRYIPTTTSRVYVNDIIQVLISQ